MEMFTDLISSQLEFRYLGEEIGIREYIDTSTNVFQHVKNTGQDHDGLYPLVYNPRSNSFKSQRVSMGGLGDSFYEYLLKVWLQGGEKETYLREMYDKAMNGVMKHLLQVTSKSKLAYVASANSIGSNAQNVRSYESILSFTMKTDTVSS